MGSALIVRPPSSSVLVRAAAAGAAGQPPLGLSHLENQGAQSAVMLMLSAYANGSFADTAAVSRAKREPAAKHYSRRGGARISGLSSSLASMCVA